METRVERVVLETPSHRIVGDLTLPKEGYRSRLSDFLNRGDVNFIPLVNAEIEARNGNGNGQRQRRDHARASSPSPATTSSSPTRWTPPDPRRAAAGLPAYFGAIRIAPSRRIVSPFSIGLATIAATSCANSLGLAEPARERDVRAERRLRVAPGGPRAAACRRGPGRSSSTRIPRGARSRAAGSVMPTIPRLRRRVGDLADLAVERGDRGGADEDAALAPSSGSLLVHRRRREPHQVEHADQVDLDDVVEEVRAGAGPLAGDPLRPADPGAADRDPQPAIAGELDCGVDGGLDRASSVTFASRKRARSPSSSASASPFSRVQVRDHDAGAGTVQAPDGGLAEAGGPAADDRALSFDIHAPDPIRRRPAERCRARPGSRPIDQGCGPRGPYGVPFASRSQPCLSSIDTH